MASGELLKDLVKPPFANYDVVVYFGCGLFALPFLAHYLGRHQVHFLRYDFGFQAEFVTTLITTLTLLFSVYILGHIIAYAGSQFVERTMDSFFGKTSTVILLASGSPKDALNDLFRRQLKRGWKESFSRASWLAATVRFTAHLPALPVYMMLIWFNVFGYFRSRVPLSVMEAVRLKFKTLPLSDTTISKHVPWFKPLEGYVINNYPTATARMYNYLVISGLFRSLCLIFLVSLWFELGYLAWRVTNGSAPPGILMFEHNTLIAQAMSYGAMLTVYLFSLFSYLKFQRRYVEEALFAFVLTEPGN